MDKRYFQAEIKEVEIKKWSIKIKWFASTPDVDRYNDIVNPKAFKDSIDWYMENPIILLQHNSDKPIWKTIEAKITSNGLNITVELTNDIDNVFKNIQDWILRWFSIWFIPKKWEYKMEWDKEIREITQLDLIEVSVVSTPANANSLFSLSKSIKSFFEELKEDNLINNKESMKTEIKEIEEIIEQGWDIEKEITEETNEEIIEWTNTIAPDEVESADAISATEEETITEQAENAKEVEVKSTDDETGISVKKFEAMKKELEEHKKLLGTFIDTLLEMSTQTQEIKSVVNNIPVRRWLATMWNEKKTIDPFVKQLLDARNSI